jgi:hypothetical protein
MSDPIHEAAMDLLHKMEAAGEAMDIEEADSFIVCAITPETGHRSHVGSFPGPVEAMAFANEWATDLNRGTEPNDEPYTTEVYPMMSPDR